ncbi:MAG: sterol-binding protein [endosymbiont of Galathealinum brachiosum]|uniref:Ubiquinone biosynthesis accessory factor UbiT n=1 Tax=endosymbiont of Galathealinum brachiosum TaxID=2200906 RepID=A0A370DFZ0_9GAMM|nr:MAG: sterol-binding protein [endosymbiont of Galathealinum brachiosum]
MNLTTNIEKAPDLPNVLSLPFKMLPSSIHSRILASFLNKLLKDQINEGELDFLEDKRLCVTVSDLNIEYYVGLKSARLISMTAAKENDIKIQANIYDFLQLAARQQDPDTLVFQRRLIMQGDTELGLELKNFLDGLDLESKGSFAKIESLLIKSLPVYKRLFS